MYRIDSPGSNAGAWVDRDAVGGIPGTQFVAAWMNEIQEEICNLLAGFDVALVKGTRTQLRDMFLGFAPPIGAIHAVTGTFSAANNGGAYSEIGVTVGARWKLCDGSQVADAASPFNGRYVPKLDDGRFLRGNATAGGVGGQATLNPSTAFAAAGSYSPAGTIGTHSLGITELANHAHSPPGGSNAFLTDALGTPAVAAGGALGSRTLTGGVVNTDGSATSTGLGHNHNWTPTPEARGNFFLNASVNIEPKYLDAKYYMRIK